MGRDQDGINVIPLEQLPVVGEDVGVLQLRLLLGEVAAFAWYIAGGGDHHIVLARLLVDTHQMVLADPHANADHRHTAIRSLAPMTLPVDGAWFCPTNRSLKDIGHGDGGIDGGGFLEEFRQVPESRRGVCLAVIHKMMFWFQVQTL